jgi:Ulp1 family protease
LNLFESGYIDLIHGFLSIALDVDKSLLISGWSFIKIFKPSQCNSFDCGAFICLYARYFFLNSLSSFSQNQIPDFRVHVLNEILAAEIQVFDSQDLNFAEAGQ